MVRDAAVPARVLSVTTTDFSVRDRSMVDVDEMIVVLSGEVFIQPSVGYSPPSAAFTSIV